jgi:ABC-type uncharacterized transport system substrate-binding protein
MRRRDFIKVIAGATAVCPLVVRAQQQVGKVFHIGVLEQTSQALNSANLDAFRQGLLKSGYVEGQNLVIEYRSGDGREERFPNLAIELARLNVDLILTRGTPAALAAKNATRIDALVVALDGLLSQNRQIIVDLAAKHRLPAVYGSSEFIIAGGLAAYGPSYSDLYLRAANYVDKILKGTRPADLPVELPTKFQLVINLKTSKSLGLTIPPTILARADEVIE